MVKKFLAVDIETTGLNFLDDSIRLISAFSEDVDIVTNKIEDLRDQLENREILKIFHNAPFDVSFLRKNGIDVRNYTDTLVMAQVLENKARGDGRSLAFLAEKYLGIYMDKSLQNGSNWDADITEKHREYARKDAQVTWRLYLGLKEKIAKENLEGVLKREIKALPSVVRLKLDGIKFNFEGWQKVLKEMKSESEKLKAEIRLICNNNDLNLESPTQVRKALQSLGLKIESTADNELKKIRDDHAVVPLIRKYKRKKKNLIAFGSKLKDSIGSDGRLRGDWSLIGTETFRMGCRKPPLQAMPRAARPYFEAEAGHSLILADYATIELRILGVITKDPELLRAFKNGEDLHKKTAGSVFKKEAEEISKLERDVGKIINFGIVYGMSSFGIQKKVSNALEREISLTEAENYRRGYFSLYKRVLDYQNSMLKACYISSLGGRIWRDKDLDKGSVKRYNYPIQSGMAEGLKESLILLLKELERNQSWKLVNVIHDEIILEVPDEEVEVAKVALEKAMVEGMERITEKIVPISVDIDARKSWAV